MAVGYYKTMLAFGVKLMADFAPGFAASGHAYSSAPSTDGQGIDLALSLKRWEATRIQSWDLDRKSP